MPSRENLSVLSLLLPVLQATCNQAGATVPATPAAPTENDPASRRPTSVQLIVGDDSLPDAGAPILAFGSVRQLCPPPPTG